MPFPSYDCVPATNMKMRRNKNLDNPDANILVAAAKSMVSVWKEGCHLETIRGAADYGNEDKFGYDINRLLNTCIQAVC